MTHEYAVAPRAPQRNPLALRHETRIHAGRYAPVLIGLATLWGYLALRLVASSSHVGAP